MNYKCSLSDMAVLVENPTSLDNELKGPVTDDVHHAKLADVIHLKEARFDDRGLLQISTVKHKPEIIKYDMKHKTRSAKTKDTDNRSETTRPLTGLTNENRLEVEKSEIQTTALSVTVERKPLHNIQPGRSVTDHGRSFGGAHPVHIGSAPPMSSPTAYERGMLIQQHRTRRVPTRMVRLATVSMSAKTKPQSRGQMASLYYEEPKKPPKVITWDEANNARPPLRIDMEGPGPCTYSAHNVKPLNETNSPVWTFGGKCDPEREGGCRTSWEKTWFQTPHIWQTKVDFYNDTSWPSPNIYKQRPLLGPKQRTFSEAPSFTIGNRKQLNLEKKGSDKEPSPNSYEKSSADKSTFNKAPAYSHQFRRSGTVLWAHPGKTPGPAAYTPRFDTNKTNKPAFTIRSLRREKSHCLGPFSTF
ncbi:Hypothetical predicted protein [Mytilus galloprovincialis]|uniref:Uncharacterized protein n=2 Tax=Mytilus galloprovincialis TaxID=29158 RepID=A0A8B6H1S0_MYTGA|nr:Hypothetical predicted protein [Mytilus galloprovincialis]